VFDGRAFKRWGRELLEAGRISLDSSTFREATVQQRGSRLIIRAKRYSTTNCYWDDGYQMSIEREGASDRIIDERLAANLTSHCQESVPLLPSTGTSPDLAALTAASRYHGLQAPANYPLIREGISPRLLVIVFARLTIRTRVEKSWHLVKLNSERRTLSQSPPYEGNLRDCLRRSSLVRV
jgi:hypothetical protein